MVVPAYKTPAKFLREMIESLEVQTYTNWELCIANASPEDVAMSEVLREYTSKDARVKVENLKENLGIAENTNAAMEMASGEYTGLLDHDDLLAPQALYRIVEALNQSREEPDVFYSDEDKVTTDLSEHFQPHFKPDFNVDLLRSNNYITHFFVVRTSLIRQVGGFRREYDGAQDYDSSSVVRRLRRRFAISRRCCITGGRIRHPRRTIRQARCMRLRRERELLKHI